MAAVVAVTLMGANCEVLAQTASTTSAGTMWGTLPSRVAVTGAADSANAHNANSALAASVTAARKAASGGGALSIAGSGSSLTIEAVGSQTIVSNQVSGNGISGNVSATQSATNTAPVSNQSTFNQP